MQQKKRRTRVLLFVPPQVVPEVAQSAYNRDFRPLHVSWCVKNVLVRTPREIHGFPGTNIVIFAVINNYILLLNYVLPVLFRIKERVVMAVHAQDMSKQIPMNPRATAHINRSYMDYLLGSAYPMIDELGIEPMINDYGEKFEGFNLVLNAAERYHRPIFVTTNLTEEQIYERYGDRTMDRLTHLCRTIHFKGDSLRK